MRTVEFTPIQNILVQDRARKEFSIDGINRLMEGISTQIGLIHPILILDDNTLIAGERRLRAITALHETGKNIQFAGEPIPINTIPTIKVKSVFDVLDLLIAEDVENSAREPLTWQEQAALVAHIAKLQQLKIDKQKETAVPNFIKKEPAPGINALLNTLSATKDIAISNEAAKAASREIHGKDNAGYLQNVQTNLKLNDALQNPELAKVLNKAPTQKEAIKLLQVEERKIMQGRIAHAQGAELRGEQHTIIQGDCLEELRKLPDASINVCCCDPIYGINAHNFGVAKRDTGFHDYEDTPEEFERIMPQAIKEVSRILKPAAHMYLFCDLSKFYQLKNWIETLGTPSNPWKVQSFPLHWIKINGARCPHPGFTFRKTVEYIIFAYRGGKQSHHQLDSHWEVSTKRTEIHGAAKEPEGLKILLNNSCYPGDKVLDFMAGSGSTVVACNELKLKCTAIEIDKVAYGRMVQRVKEFKNEVK